MLDVLGEIASAPPWVYRGWAFLFSKNYRAGLKEEYKKMSSLLRPFDILFSLVFFIGEFSGLLYLGYWVFNNVG